MLKIVDAIYSKYWPYLGRIGHMEARVKAAIKEAYEQGKADATNQLGNHMC